MREMKDSGIEWIGEIPGNWSIRRLRFLCTIETGNMDTQDHNPEGKYPFYVRSPIVEYSDSFTFDNEAVLMAGDGVGAGKIFHYVNGKYGCHQRVYSLHSFAQISGKFLYYYLLENFHKKIEENNAKSTVDSIRLPMIKDFPVVLPPFEVQQKITDYLDHKCGQIETIIARQQEVIEKLKAYKLSVITEAVTKGLNPDVPMKDSGVEWIGEIPQCWSGKRLADLCDRGITYGIVKLGNEDESGIKVLRCSDVNPGYIDESNIRTVTSSLSKEYNRTILRGGEVVVNVRGTLGGCAIVPEHMRGYNIAREVAMVSVTKANPQFVMYNILSKAFQSYQQYSLRGVIYTGLNIGLLSKYMLFLPSIDEQEYIVKFLNEKITYIDRVIQKKQCLLDYLQDYKKALIYEVVTGKKEV